MNQVSEQEPVGVIFEAQDIRAFLEGRKSQYRALFLPQPHPIDGGWKWKSTCGRHLVSAYGPEALTQILRHCIDVAPFQPGGVLYAQEEWCGWEREEDLRDHIHYRADDARISIRNRYEEAESIVGCFDAWQSPESMPSYFARIWLRVIQVSIQRLQDITDAEAIKEGIRQMPSVSDTWIGWERPDRLVAPCGTPAAAFANLAAHRYGLDAWRRNDWVWVFDVLAHPNPHDTKEEPAG